MTDFKKNLINHFKKYPKMEIEDVFKFIFHCAFGCEHMVSDLDTAISKIKDEYNLSPTDDNTLTEELNEKYVRVHLSYLKNELSAKTLGLLFFLSSKAESEGENAVFKMLLAVKELISDGRLPFSYTEFSQKAEKWESDGFPALHHSEAFRTLYSPKYRVISRAYLPFLPLLAYIDSVNRNRLIIAVDGGSASGKTTLASLIEKIYGASVFHMDDFFLTPEMRTPERLSEIGGNVDRERFEKEILIPLMLGQSVNYRRFDCHSGAFSSPVSVKPSSIVIIEGAYSMHPRLSKYYDFSVFLSIGRNKQRDRILKRNSPSLAKRFFDEWIPLENLYFEKTEIEKRCDLVIDI